MARKKKEKIAFDQEPASLNDAFGGLAMDGLAAGPEQVEPAPPQKKKKAIVTLKLRRETAKRGGKTVVVIYDFPRTVHNDTIATLARALKQHCGCGGTVKQREIQIQGEKVPEVKAYLIEQEYNVKGG